MAGGGAGENLRNSKLKKALAKSTPKAPDPADIIRAAERAQKDSFLKDKNFSGMQISDEVKQGRLGMFDKMADNMGDENIKRRKGLNVASGLGIV